MAITECANGHVYDSSIHSSCPYCSEGIYRVDFGMSNEDIGKTVLLDEDSPAYAAADDTGKTVLLDEDVPAYEGSGNRADTGFQNISPLPSDKNAPAPGRLICTQGEDMGREIVLRAGETIRVRDGNYIFVPFWSER